VVRLSFRFAMAKETLLDLCDDSNLARVWWSPLRDQVLLYPGGGAAGYPSFSSSRCAPNHPFTCGDHRLPCRAPAESAPYPAHSALWESGAG
jgi:hypothetical protein